MLLAQHWPGAWHLDAARRHLDMSLTFPHGETLNLMLLVLPEAPREYDTQTAFAPDRTGSPQYAVIAGPRAFER
jgi:hypothetical protein